MDNILTIPNTTGLRSHNQNPPMSQRTDLSLNFDHQGQMHWLKDKRKYTHPGEQFEMYKTVGTCCCASETNIIACQLHLQKNKQINFKKLKQEKESNKMKSTEKIKNQLKNTKIKIPRDMCSEEMDTRARAEGNTRNKQQHLKESARLISNQK